MLNFREELGKTVETKRKEAMKSVEEKRSEVVHNFLVDFIDKLNNKELCEFAIPLKFLFGFCGKAVYVKEFHVGGELINIIMMQKNYTDPSEAYTILMLLEKKFISEGYEIVDKTSAEEGHFHVIINT